MQLYKPEDIIADLAFTPEEWGDLVLGIYCQKCDAQFELNNEYIAMALISGASVWEFIKCIQSSNCQNCNPQHLDKESPV